MASSGPKMAARAGFRCIPGQDYSWAALGRWRGEAAVGPEQGELFGGLLTSFLFELGKCTTYPLVLYDFIRSMGEQREGLFWWMSWNRKTEDPKPTGNTCE